MFSQLALRSRLIQPSSRLPNHSGSCQAELGRSPLFEKSDDYAAFEKFSVKRTNEPAYARGTLELKLETGLVIKCLSRFCWLQTCRKPRRCCRTRCDEFE